MLTIIRMDQHGPDHTVVTATCPDRGGLTVATVQCYHNLSGGRTELAWERLYADENDAVEYHGRFICGLTG